MDKFPQDSAIELRARGNTCKTPIAVIEWEILGMARKSLDNMSLDELQTLRKEVNAAIESFMDRKRAAALKAMEAVAKDHGLSLDDVIGGGKKRRKAKTVAKYRNPSDSSQTWSGRGRQPGWFKDALKGGTPAEKLEI